MKINFNELKELNVPNMNDGMLPWENIHKKITSLYM